MKKLYKNLMKLTEDKDESKFFFKDAFTSLGTKVRVFSYHIASYSDWLLPDALEARGIMFEMNAKDQPVRIMCRPMQKFFNLNENPMTMNLDLSEILFYMTKEDGSLISTYQDQGYLFLKSKTSVESDQVQQASAWLNQPINASFKEALKDVTNQDKTVNMEWVSPENRIVLGYSEPALIVLNIRDNKTGEYLDPQTIFRINGLRGNVVQMFEPDADPEAWVKRTRESIGIEGYVAVMKNNIFKLKTDWYCSLHHTKDSISNPKRLWECCAENATDDLRQMFEADKVSLERINEFDQLYADSFSEALCYVKNFYDKHRGQDRKSFAVAGQIATKEDDKRHLFGLIMLTFNGFDSDKMIEQIKTTLVKNSELYVK
ncbi:RNA ligase [Citrobacter phage Ci1]|nr:RNA ligase [Citrobacter phage Ci1]